MHVRKDDIVEILVGDDAGTSKNRTTGRVLQVFPKRGKVLVEGINRVYKHLKPNRRNAQGGRLPTWFQNLLPEGVLRSHIAQLRGCREDDHFELLAACGGDLPGAVSARPVEVDRPTLQRLVTQDQDALEMSVVANPLPQGISVSGVQPKLGLARQGGRYTARTRAGTSTRVIAKRTHIPGFVGTDPPRTALQTLTPGGPVAHLARVTIRKIPVARQKMYFVSGTAREVGQEMQVLYMGTP